MTHKQSPFFTGYLLQITTILFLVTVSQWTKAAQVEAWYQKVWCQGMKGKIEVRMKDGRRIDCLTDTYAIEFEFARKWPEAVGQSLDYSMLTGKKAGIVLVLKRAEEVAYWQRLNAVVNHYRLPIRLWRMGP